MRSATPSTLEQLQEYFYLITVCILFDCFDSPFTELWQSCSETHPKIYPIAIFAFYSLNYSLAARSQDNSCPKLRTKIETKRKLQQFIVSGWLIMNGGESGSEEKEKDKTKIIFNVKSQFNYQPLFARIIIFTGH